MTRAASCHHKALSDHLSDSRPKGRPIHLDVRGHWPCSILLFGEPASLLREEARRRLTRHARRLSFRSLSHMPCPIRAQPHGARRPWAVTKGSTAKHTAALRRPTDPSSKLAPRERSVAMRDDVSDRLFRAVSVGRAWTSSMLYASDRGTVLPPPPALGRPRPGASTEKALESITPAPKPAVG